MSTRNWVDLNILFLPAVMIFITPVHIVRPIIQIQLIRTNLWNVCLVHSSFLFTLFDFRVVWFFKSSHTFQLKSTKSTVVQNNHHWCTRWYKPFHSSSSYLLYLALIYSFLQATSQFLISLLLCTFLNSFTKSQVHPAGLLNNSEPCFDGRE